MQETALAVREMVLAVADFVVKEQICFLQEMAALSVFAVLRMMHGLPWHHS